MIKRFTVKGLVQGIGYRPWVARLAEELNIDGWVRNTGGIVTVLASGDEEDLVELGGRLSKDVPTGGFVTSVEVEDVESAEVSEGFRIVESDKDVAANLPLIPADIATCDRCKAELLDSTNRRYLHPFISCTICGPRYSIIERLPYDRDTITMGDFDMCPECEKEYTAKADRRRHAQTIACMNCGPKLAYKLISGHINTDNGENAGNLADMLAYRNFGSEFLKKSENNRQIMEDLRIKVPELYQSIVHILNGGILAVKDIGGYHLVCNPFDEDAVAKLRLLKHREAKAFAVMFFDVDEIREYCSVNQQESDLLKSAARPIVLLKRNQTGIKKLADNVCLSSPSIGAMLPCNPVQIILAKICGPLIMTSGNASGDVLETDDARMEKWLATRAKSEEMKYVSIAMLSHNRRILRPMDDSVMKIVKGRQQFIRRGRGHAPSPILVDIEGEVFAAGGDLKSSFCYVKNGLAYVSQYLGDMESVSCQKFYRNEKRAMTTIFGFKPRQIDVDKHPGYFSRKTSFDYASNQLKVVEVQHHKAHVASVIAEHKLKGAVLGFAFDGTGYGDDGTIWGSETFFWDGN
ncbi:MAG: carbamoyltransferase HypF, partial [Pseudobutyrivibrio sp.]|nr:carbamoyltransferase HypF [Pseudobutyrivibrio sp.]